MKTNELRHLYWRIGFGINPTELVALSSKSKKEIVKSLFDNASKDSALTIDTSDLVSFYKSNRGKMSREDRMKAQKMSRKKVQEYNNAWFQRLYNSDQLLNERMHLFWTNHFVCRDQNILHYQKYNNTMRHYALGNFGDFVKAISKEASMLKYLNNKQNVKEKPNENFGRELMELFTLGIDNYSEKDIKEAARAFTGWNHDFRGNFVLRDKKHDFGKKEFLGESGAFGGEEIIDVILAQKQCARYICSKVYKEFVNPEIDEKNLEEITELFYHDYDIKKLMRYIFMSDWFYDKRNMGVKIKSPVELIVGLHRLVPFQFEQSNGVLFFQKELGQVLTNPPNVAGWKGGTSWIDSNTMLVRLKLPSMLLNNSVIALEEKGDLEESYEMYYKRMNNRKKYIKVTANWNNFNEEFHSVLESEMPRFLLNGELSSSAQELISNLEINNKRDYCIQLMSLPEYQMS
ncbi:DUF1800 domain-containing protein [Urechidicola vernalis]|uniref:DUF1800 domain-containing protein n=1 Tax=Urechidicola vernalis TaxID=3075600 RepID=A0ABU2Y405_9FLAO|nr:DUF1800 domain-containing protein [Urechidicola sp. P050]MDT0552525.1 DUF1800 domain-containing protein [Urechidicola sp. P050]